MSRERKAQIIDSLQEILSKCSTGILTDYRGLSTAEMNDLRRKLRASRIDYKVVKNTLAQFAARRAGMDELAGSLEGPVAMAFGYGEITEPARVLADYIRTSKSTLSIKGGFLGDERLTLEEVMTLSALPSREVLLAKALGSMQSPILGLLNCLTAPMREVMGILQARIQQLEGG